MELNKVILLLRENWNILPRYQKVQLLEILHEHFSLREMAKLLGKGAKTVHWYLKYETRDYGRFFHPNIIRHELADNSFHFKKQQHNIADLLLSKTSDLALKAPNARDDEIIKPERR